MPHMFILIPTKDARGAVRVRGSTEYISGGVSWEVLPRLKQQT